MVVMVVVAQQPAEGFAILNFELQLVSAASRRLRYFFLNLARAFRFSRVAFFLRSGNYDDV
jgi:hypothetical protein